MTMHRLGLSTCWNARRHTSAAAILDEHAALGFDRLEAYCLHTPTAFAELAAEARKRGIQIQSLHSPCPVAVNENGTPAFWGDWLSSTNEPDRQRAVDVIRRSIDAAVEVGARAMVIHLGTTGVYSHQRVIFDTIARDGAGSDAHRRLIETAVREREAKKGPHLEAGLRSIRALGEHASGTGVRLGVECRDNYQEIPSLDEVADVLAAVEGLPVGYWHDAGHGAKLENAGFVEHEEYLRRYGSRLVGMHLHDTVGSKDHQGPGQGHTDFAMLARYVRPDTVLTMELHSDVLPEHVISGVELLLAHGIGTDAPAAVTG
ncbi:MAG: sugar phosphate isomerase/epimerase [Chloroflexi bacterium]|nr:sugar phosphate isomerase/epimerase [Chloroflexota bacterium]